MKTAPLFACVQVPAIDIRTKIFVSVHVELLHSSERERPTTGPDAVFCRAQPSVRVSCFCMCVANFAFLSCFCHVYQNRNGQYV
jgi:hypothetical protein